MKCPEFTEFGISDISNMSKSILMLKIIFMKHLRPVTPKIVLKLNMPRVY